ncbi:hemolysin III family protein [Mycoplasmatota bacterium WC44]
MELVQENVKYELWEDLANAISHGLGVVFGIIALIRLTYIASVNGSVVDVIAFSLYGVSILFMFTMSTVYHSIRNPKVKKVFRRLDHSMVYLLILGTYTPFVFTSLNTKLAHIVYIILAVITILGIVYKSLFINKFKILSTLMYVIMGWLCVMLISQLLERLPSQSIFFLVLGGVIYTAGAVIYAFSKFKYHHLIWHIFVLLGAISHYISIAYFVL